MSEEFNFSELRNYLMEQADMGSGLDELYLDEPWTLTRTPAMPGAAPARPIMPPPRPQVVNTPPSRPAFSGNPAGSYGAPSAAPSPAPVMATASAVNVPAPRVAKRSACAYESAENLSDFYGQIKSEAVYVKEPSLVGYLGPQRPKVLFLLPAVKVGTNPNEFFQSPVGEMLVRLFANLNVGPESIGVTYFFKSTERPLPPLLETALKKMLSKELALIAPEVMVSFGQNLFYQLFGKAKNFDELAGSDMDFGGVRTCSLIDPYQMVNEKQLKWLTWKVHIPRSTLFTVKQP